MDVEILSMASVSLAQLVKGLEIVVYEFKLCSGCGFKPGQFKPSRFLAGSRIHHQKSVQMVQ